MEEAIQEIKEKKNILPQIYSSGCDIREISGEEMVIKEVTPNEIYSLPRQCWCAAKNAYACHGFMKYGKLYLIESDGVYLAVPGYKNVNDEIVATKYGFKKFIKDEVVCLGVSSARHWHRGYWCKKIM